MNQAQTQKIMEVPARTKRIGWGWALLCGIIAPISFDFGASVIAIILSAMGKNGALADLLIYFLPVMIVFSGILGIFLIIYPWKTRKTLLITSLSIPFIIYSYICVFCLVAIL